MPATLERNLLLYPWYAGVLKAYFWLPVFFLYFTSLFSLSDVLRLEAIYYVAVVLFEVPSGYFSDVAGRRKTLLVANIAIVIAHCLFFFGSHYSVFVLAQVSLALGLAFNSGTDTSLHYESLAGIGKQSEFEDREAKVARNTFIAGAFAALIGGGIALFHLRFAYGLSILSALISFAIVIAMKEPTVHDTKASIGHGFLHQIILCLRFLRQPSLLWLVAFSILMVVLNHVPYEFYQPYIKLERVALGFPAESASLISGAMTAMAMLFASVVAAKSVWISNRLGLAQTLLLAMVLQIVVISAMGWILHPIVFGLILLRTCPRALMTAPLNAAIAPQVSQRQRATFFSLQSLAGRLSFSGLLVLFSFVVGSNHETYSNGIFQSLHISSAIGVGGLLILVVTAGALRKIS